MLLRRSLDLRSRPEPPTLRVLFTQPCLLCSVACCASSLQTIGKTTKKDISGDESTNYAVLTMSTSDYHSSFVSAFCSVHLREVRLPLEINHYLYGSRLPAV